MVRPILTGTAYADWLHLQAAASAMEVNAGAGNDGVFGGAFDDLIRGGDGDDQLWGNDGGDTLMGDAGNDQAWGGEGNDSLNGGTGNDQLWGDNGNDTLIGGAGDDQLWGGEGADNLEAGAGQDQLWGGNGNDTMALGDGNDQAWGEEGNDSISTGTGNDTVYAGNGDDSVDGGNGDDSLTGEAGNDTIMAGQGRNIVSGGEGQDVITAGSGNDSITGDNGDDVIDAGAGNNTVHGGEGHDAITTGSGNDSITGDNGNDVIEAGAGNNTVWSGQGADSVNTGSGNDTIGTDDGNDTVQSGGGNDFVYGNGGDDLIEAGAGNDFVTGDMGSDTLKGGAGDDKIYGGEGDDRIVAGEGADRVYADGGNDTVVHSRGAVAGDFFNGGAGTDTLAFDMTQAEWQDSAFQTELTSYLARLGAGKTGLFNFTSQGLQVTNFERVSIKVDGKEPTNANANADAAVTAKADAFSVTEDAASLSGNVLTNDLVPDLVAKIEVTSAATAGTLAMGQDGAFTWNGGADFQSLAAGESRAVTFSYKVTDNDGDTGTAQATITVQGQNDGPAIGAGATTGAVTELADGVQGEGSALRSASGSLAFTDADLTDTHAVAVSGSGLGKLSASIATDSTGGKTGAIAWSYSVNDGALDALKAGETRVETFNLTLTDGKGGSSVQSVSITLTGSNDGPTATADFAKTDEDTATKIDLLGNDSDVDGDALTLVGTSASEYGAAIKIDGGAVVYDPSASAKLQALGAGETATDSFTYTLRDANGAETTQTVTVTVAGLADKVENTVIASFEDGLDKGWQRTGDVSNVSGGTLGEKAALLSTDDAKDQKEVEGWLQLSKGTLDKLGFGDADEGSAIRGKVELEAGQSLGFDWLFDAAAKSGGNDFSFVTLRHDGENKLFGLADVKMVGEGGESGWQSFSFKAEAAGSYEIGIGVMDVGSSDGHSTLMVDNVWFG